MITEIGVLLALEDSRSTTTKSSMTLEKTSTALAKMAGPSSRACTMMAGQLTFQVTRPSTSARVPRCTDLNSTVKAKNMATPKISSGITKDRIIRKLKLDDVIPRHRLMPSANATPSGTAISVVNTDSRTV